MSVISTVANYGGRVIDNQQGVRQFVVGATGSTVPLIYSKQSGTLFVTPSDNHRSFLLDNDLVVKKNLYVEGAIYNPSDVSLKSGIQPILPSQADGLLALNPVRFHYKKDPRQTPHFGLLAQEVEEVFPELVRDTTSTTKAVNYQELVPILLAKMKQMQETMNQMQETMDVLKERIGVT